MLVYPLRLVYVFKGNLTDEHSIDLYDLSQSLYGLQRSLAITTHFLLSGKIITKAPALKNASILVTPAEEGSFKQVVSIGVVLTALTGVLSTPKDSVFGHILYSAYDYVVKKTLGVHVNFDEPLYKTYLQHEDLQKEIKQSQLDSVSEKCEEALEEMHRPIFASQTAKSAAVIPISFEFEDKRLVLNMSTYESLRKRRVSDDAEIYTGRVGAFNANTGKGRVFTKEEERPIPFEIEQESVVNMSIFSRSLALYTRLKEKAPLSSDAGYFKFKAKRVYSANDTTKKYLVTYVYKDSLVRE